MTKQYISFILFQMMIVFRPWNYWVYASYEWI